MPSAWLPGSEPSAATVPCRAVPDEYTLGTGDRLSVTVFGHEDLSGEFTISETGAVSLPLAGSLNLSGRTVREAERAVVDALKPDYLLNPRVGNRGAELPAVLHHRAR